MQIKPMKSQRKFSKIETENTQYLIDIEKSVEITKTLTEWRNQIK